MKQKQAAALVLALLLAGCGLAAGEGEGQAPGELPGEGLSAPAPEDPQPSPEDPEKPTEPAEPRGEALHPYLRQLVEETAAGLVSPGMSQYDRAKAAFDYMIRSTSFEEPIGLELWRIHGGGEEPIPYLEQRALSPLRFGIGTCEDYAAALTLLLREMGLRAQYVPGLTFSVEGNLVDHAWTVVEIDGTWYHLDSQLEDNISRRGRVRYKYFLRGDNSLLATHRWGQNLVDSGLLPPEQQEELQRDWLTPACPRDLPPPQETVFPETFPNLSLLKGEAAEELAAWEAKNGPLPPMTLNTVPPVFGLGGYGPADEG